MIAAVKDVPEFKKAVERAKNEFTTEELEKIEKKIFPLQEDDATSESHLISSMIFLFNEKSIYTGYVSPRIERVKNIILFFVNKYNGVFETKLNKLLFYSDFLCFKERGIGLSGLSYRAIDFGPVPQRYSTVYENVGGTDAEIVIYPNGNEGKRIVRNELFNPALFSEYEIGVLNRVNDRFMDCKAVRISEISHQEDAWIENVAHKNKIRYDYGFKLKAL